MDSRGGGSANKLRKLKNREFADINNLLEIAMAIYTDPSLFGNLKLPKSANTNVSPYK
jgi:hypothetical protein